MQRIVLLHGWGVHAPKHITALEKELRSKGYEVFTPDLPGFGDADIPSKPWYVSDYVDWVVHAIKEKSWDSVVVCGHSFGGRIAIKMALEHPELVSHVVLIASAGIKHKLSWRGQLISTAGKIGRFVFNLPVLNKLLPAVHETWRFLLGRRDYYMVSGVMQQTFLNIIDEDLKPIIPNITKPALIMWGKKDTLVPLEDAYYLKESIKDARLKVYSQGDHTIPYNYPTEIAEEIDNFLRDSNTKETTNN